MGWKNLALAVACASLMVGFAFAQGTDVPGDSDGDRIVSAEELAAAEKLANEGKLSADELEEIRHIHEKYPITIIDSADRTVTVYKPVKRMISQGTWAYEPIFVLDAQDRLSAVTNTAQRVYGFVPGIKDKPVVGEYREIDYEKVIENRPDLYIIGGNRTLSDIEQKLEPVGSTIVVLSFSDMKKFEKEFRALAMLLEEDEAVEEYLAWREGYLKLIADKTKDLASKQRIYNEYSDIPWTTGALGSGINDVITMAGGLNIGSSLETVKSAEVAPEWVMAQNPEVIIIPAFLDYAPTDLTGYHLNSADNAMRFIKEASARTGWKETDAVKNGRVFVLDGETGSASCRGIVGVCYCAKWFYPDVFADLDPDAINREYFERWLGAPYSGIWAYPEAS
ncbi:MAG TPA: ABC transporter substrate-binding protein [Methanotrichaceae archaeon]|nr:ABC transporter substrate-binding protein [Methanotrichaceae archaeon]HQF15753.1 ABC transporter substrate-binding protein [Methanotrichaceae archaeon]HQI90574.1 ABC transporter substrate-binding protein [Methanotrichaceae archaeon]